MKPAPFDFHRADSIDDAISILEQGTMQGLDVKVIAGGQSLVALMNMRLARPQLLVDLNGIGDLSYIRDESGGLRVGSMTRQRSLEFSEAIRRGWPLLTEAVPFVAHTPIRSRGTLGGSLAHADPGAELCAVGLALDASVTLRGSEGDRVVALRNFFLGPFTTALQPSEILVEVEFPAMPDRSGWAFEEVARRRGDFALAGVAARIACDRDGRITEARLAYLSVGPVPARVDEAERALLGEKPDADLFARAGEIASDALDALEDIHAGAEYRSHLTKVLTSRALATASARARLSESAEHG